MRRPSLPSASAGGVLVLVVVVGVVMVALQLCPSVSSAARVEIELEEEARGAAKSPPSPCSKTAIISGGGSTIKFPYTSDWVVPGVLSPGSVGVATETCCYMYFGSELQGIPLNLTGFERIPFYNSNTTQYSSNLFLFGYYLNDTSQLYMIRFNSCAVGVSIEPVIELWANGVARNETIVAIVDDPNKNNNFYFDYVLSLETLYIVPDPKNCSTVGCDPFVVTPLPKSNLTITPDFFTGVFYIGVSQSPNDYYYIGRGVLHNLTAPAEILVLITSDQDHEGRSVAAPVHLRTVGFVSSPLNFLRTGGFVGEDSCNFYAHQLAVESAFYVSNECTSGIQSYNNSQNHNPTSLNYLKVWPTTSNDVLVLTGTNNTDDSEPGFSIFIYFPSLHEDILIYADFYYPQLLFVTKVNETNLHPTQLVAFTRDPTTQDNVYVTFDIPELFGSDFVVNDVPPVKKEFPSFTSTSTSTREESGSDSGSSDVCQSASQGSPCPDAACCTGFCELCYCPTGFLCQIGNASNPLCGNCVFSTSPPMYNA